MKLENIFKNIHENSKEEIFEDIINTPNIKLERIISTGQSTPQGEWYDQDKDEWVILLNGSAEILFEEGNKSFILKKGDYIYIPAHTRHRVEWTDKDQPTVWLALHF